jgi:hypothetical protein
MQLYRDEGASPFAGCLPMLIQAPIVGLLYSVFLHPTIGGHPNALLTESLFGVPLGEKTHGSSRGGQHRPRDVGGDRMPRPPHRTRRRADAPSAPGATAR